jgi:monoamine oxidase
VIYLYNVLSDVSFQTAGQLWDDAMNSVKYSTYDELRAKYDKFSIQAYFIEHENMSRGAIDFISLMYNVDMQTSLIEMVRSSLILPLSPEYSQIDGGFDLLINKFERACNDVPDGRCTIYSNTRVKEVHFVEVSNNPSAHHAVRLTIGENTTIKNFDSVIVTTTARAANLIEFTPRELFVDKYHALRQLHYDCATKIVHSFSRQFWRDENIQGGSSITDLPIRFVFYNNFNTTADPTKDGALIITSYVWATDALLWSGLTKEQTCAKSLDNLIQLHNRLDIRSLNIGCEVKNWCTDQYSLGAYALFTPYQETNLHDELGKSIKNTVFFTGEHISLNHRWIEGAIQSSVRLLMHLQVRTVQSYLFTLSVLVNTIEFDLSVVLITISSNISGI